MKKLLIATLTGLLICLAILHAHAAAGLMNEMPGTWTTNPRYITFGDYNGHLLVWRVLEIIENDSDFGGVKTAFLLLDDLLRDSSGNVESVKYGSSNSFPNSRIKEWLNDDARGFLACFNTISADILDTKYSPGYRNWPGGLTGGSSKVYLLSAEEANNYRYFVDDADRVVANKAWWLRSPGYDYDIAAVVFSAGDVAGNGLYVSNTCAVRPAIKIDLTSSSTFAALPVSYGMIAKADGGNSPISGAKFSLFPFLEASSAESFTNSAGIARFANVTQGTHTFTVTKPGYITKSESITVPAMADPAVSLMPDPTALPGRVKFGKYEGKPIEWEVLDVVNCRALLFAGTLFEMYFDSGGSSMWVSSTLRAYLNSSNAGDFLQEANFTATEAAAIDVANSTTGDSVFLLSSDEVYRYLPDANMRSFDGREWLMRTPFDGADVEAISPSGDYCTIPAYERGVFAWSRPAMWVDLSKVIYDSCTDTLIPINTKK